MANAADKPDFFASMEVMGTMLRAGALAVGLSPTQVLRFPDLYQIVDTGIDVAWVESGSPTGRPGWVIRETYAELDLVTDEEREVTEDVASAEAVDIPDVVKTVYLRVAGRALDHVLSEIEA